MSENNNAQSQPANPRIIRKRRRSRSPSVDSQYSVNSNSSSSPINQQPAAKKRKINLIIDPKIASQMMNQPKPSRHNKNYTSKEIEKLVDLHNEGKSYKDIANILGRTEHGVRQQYRMVNKQYHNVDPNQNTNSSNNSNSNHNHHQNQNASESKDDERFSDVDNIGCKQRPTMSKKVHLATVDTLDMSLWFYRLLKYLELEPNSGDNIRRVQQIIKGLRQCTRADQVLTDELVIEFQKLSDQYESKYGVWREDAQGVYLLHKEDRNVNRNRNRNRSNNDRKYSQTKPVIDNKYRPRYDGDVSIDYYRKLKEYFRQQNMGDDYMKIDTMMEIMMSFKDQYGDISVDDNGLFHVQKNKKIIVLE